MKNYQSSHIIKVTIGSFFSLVNSLFLFLVIFTNSSNNNETDTNTKKDSSLAWGDTHDDGWMD